MSLRLIQQAKLSVQCQLFFWPFTKAYKESISTEFGHVLIIVVKKKSLHFCIWDLTYVILIIRVSGTCKISIGSLLQAMLPVYLLPAIWTQCWFYALNPALHMSHDCCGQTSIMQQGITNTLALPIRCCTSTYCVHTLNTKKSVPI